MTTIINNRVDNSALVKAKLSEIRKQTGQTPRYKLTEKCYLDDVLYDPPAGDQEDNDENRSRIQSNHGALPHNVSGNVAPNQFQLRQSILIDWDRAPAYYMQPQNEAAKLMLEAFPAPQYRDPINELHIIAAESEKADPMKQIATLLADLAQRPAPTAQQANQLKR